MKKDRNEVQMQLRDGALYQAINEADKALRHRSEYDLLEPLERRFALLCHALCTATPGADGQWRTPVDVIGVVRTLTAIKESV